MSTTSELNNINGATLHKRSQTCFEQTFCDFSQRHVGGHSHGVCLLLNRLLIETALLSVAVLSVSG